MESYKATVVNEIFKMVRKKKAVLIVILSAAIIAVVQLLSFALRGGLGIMGSSAAGFPITVLSVFANTILPLFTALAVIDTFTGEFASDTMKISITRPVTRLKVYLAKLTAVGAFILASLMIVMVLSTATALLFNRMSPTLGWFASILAAYVSTVIPMLTLAVLIAWPANVFKSSSGVFFLSMLAFLLLRGLGVVFSSLATLLATSLLDWYKLWIASPLPLGMVLRQLLVMLGYVMIFFALGFQRFDRRDL
ncbi:MAG TPA: ABC transporter permease [Clostridiales bacterium]|nr:ABC transporter permease [Clostridiales bacterium]